MSKRPSKISEILAKRSQPSVSVVDQQDFIAETKSLVLQYQQENSPNHSTQLNNIIDQSSVVFSDVILNVQKSPTSNELKNTRVAIDELKINDLKEHSKQDTNPTQTGHLPSTKQDLTNNSHLTQTGHKPDTNGTQEHSSRTIKQIKNIIPDTNGTQTGHLPSTKRDLTNNSHLTQTGHKPDTNGTQEHSSRTIKQIKNIIPDTNGTQTGHLPSTKRDTKRDTKLIRSLNEEEAIQTLKGSQAKLFSHICESIITSGKQEIITSYEQLSFDCSVHRGSIETTLKRLCNQKGITTKRTDKGGVGARVYLSVHHEVLILYSKYKTLLQNSITTQHKRDTQPDTKRDTTPPSKLVSNINNTNYLTEETETKSTQTQDLLVAQNTGWFKTLDFSALTYIKPMMVNSAIRSLVESKLDQDDVQMFVNKFKNWLATQRNIQNPLAIFCDKLKEYANEGDSPVLGVMSDQELQIELLMAQELEKSRLELELVNKARLFKAEQEKEARFQDWLLQASDDEKKALYPETGFARIGSEIYNIGLKEAFFNQK